MGPDVPGQTDVLHTHLPAVHVLKHRDQVVGTHPSRARMDARGLQSSVPALSLPSSKMGGGDSTHRVDLMRSVTQRCCERALCGQAPRLWRGSPDGKPQKSPLPLPSSGHGPGIAVFFHHRASRVQGPMELTGTLSRCHTAPILEDQP